MAGFFLVDLSNTLKTNTDRQNWAGENISIYDDKMPNTRRPWLDDDDDEFFPDPDSRPAWEKRDPASGLSTWDALYHFIDSRMATELYELDLSGYGDEANIDPGWWPDERRDFDLNNFRYRDRLRELQARLWGKLLRGELIAYGYSNQAPLDAPRRAIIAERWEDLVLAARESTASGNGIEVTQIRVFLPGSSGMDGAPRARKSYARTELRKWYLDRIGDCAKSGRLPSRDDDYREANARFGGSVPKRAVQELRRELAPESWKRKGRRASG